MLTRKYSHVTPAQVHPPRSVVSNRSTSTQRPRATGKKGGSGTEERCKTPGEPRQLSAISRKTAGGVGESSSRPPSSAIIHPYKYLAKPPIAPRDYSDHLDTSFPSVSTAESASFHSDRSRAKLRTPSPADTRGYMQQLSKRFQLDKAALAHAVKAHSRHTASHSSGPSLDLSSSTHPEDRASSARRTYSIYWPQ